MPDGLEASESEEYGESSSSSGSLETPSDDNSMMNESISSFKNSVYTNDHRKTPKAKQLSARKLKLGPIAEDDEWQEESKLGSPAIGGK